MDIEVKTLTQGTIDGELVGYDDIKAIFTRLAECTGGWTWLELITKNGLVIINMANVVSIGQKK